jgi:mannose-6-phosphate isomerase-like protein (cupin superfamily)
MDEWGMVKSNEVVQSRRDNLRLEMQNGVVWERLADRASSLVDPLIVTYEPGAGSSLDGTTMQHNAAEFGILLEGNLTLNLDGKNYQIAAGDSFSFDAQLPHRYENKGTVLARGIWFVVSKDAKHKPSASKSKKLANSPESAVEVLALMGSGRKKKS